MFPIEDQVNNIERNQETDHRPNDFGVDDMIANFDNVTKFFGENPTSGHIPALEKHKGMTYQKRDIQNQNNYKKISPPSS